ncbi:MAG TPA: LytTR family DNA-binding domain-containing protein [Flavobacteriales bacterium]|nr:LytTR family DNA-binding domain-containing protein [Flavobacteriales bacterium]
MKLIRAIVVDDEPAARTRVVRLLSTDPEIRLVAECRNGAEALATIQQEPVDLMYLDVQMPQLSGFDVIKRFPAGLAPYVVFATAHDRYATQAFNVNAVDYLLKPYDDERFFLSLAKAKDFVEMRENKRLTGRLMDLIQDHMNSRREYTQVIVIKEKGREYRVPVKDILFIRAEGNYLILQTKPRHYLLRMTMNMVETDLDPAVFVRVHRSYMLNMAHVRNSRYSGNNEFLFTMSNGQHVLSGRSYKEHIAKILSRTTNEP